MKKLTRVVISGIMSVILPLAAETEYANGYTWTYRINGNGAEIYNGYYAAISPEPTGAVTIPSTLGGKARHDPRGLCVLRLQRPHGRHDRKRRHHHRRLCVYRLQRPHGRDFQGQCAKRW